MYTLLFLSMQALNWGTYGRKMSVSFFGIVFVCLKTCMQIHKFLVFCLYTTRMSSIALPLTGPSKIQHSIRNLVRSTGTPEETHWKSERRCMSCLNGHFLREHTDCSFPSQYQPLLCGNVNGKSQFSVFLFQYVWPIALLWLSWWVSQQEEKPTSRRSWHAI